MNEAHGVTTRAPRVVVADPRYTTERTAGPVRARQLLEAGGYTGVAEPAVIAYRMGTTEHQQTGIVTEIAIDDYRNGRVLRHEHTQPGRVHRLAEVTERTGLEHTPVLLTHAPSSELRAALITITTAAPDVRITASGVTHSLWLRSSTELDLAVRGAIGRAGPLYIADGHHRIAAAEQHACRAAVSGGADPSSFTMAALFPADEMQVHGYHRCLALPAELSEQQVLVLLAAQPGVRSIQRPDVLECGDASGDRTELEGNASSWDGSGVVPVRIDGHLHLLTLQPSSEPDAVQLDRQVLSGLAAAVGLDPIPVAEAGSGCACMHARTAHFHPRPPSVERIMALADDGEVLPPKSTWFSPKAKSGLLVRAGGEPGLRAVQDLGGTGSGIPA